MTLAHLRTALTEGIGRLLHHTLLLSAEDIAIARAELDLFQNDDDALQKLHDRLPQNMQG